MEYRLQTGEFEVVKILFQQSIPKLLGWDALVNMQVESNLRKAGSNSGGGGNSNRWRGKSKGSYGDKFFSSENEDSPDDGDGGPSNPPLF